MKYAWIDEQRNDYALDAMCSVLEISVSGYRSWKRGGTPDRTRLTDAQMLARIRIIHEALNGANGSPRMVKELRGRGVPASKERVERLMREHLGEGYSPEQIAGRLQRAYSDDMRKHLSTETIHVGLYVLPRGVLRSALLAALRQARKARRPRRGGPIDAATSPT